MFSTYAQKLLILQKKVSHKNSVCEQLRFLETELSHFEDNIYELKKDVARKLLNLESYNRPSVKNVFLKLVGQMPREIMLQMSITLKALLHQLMLWALIL